jgi:hypothetical protein
MEMKRLLWGFVTIALCSLSMLTSCNSAEDSKESQEMREKIQNTRWKMSEIYTEPNKDSSQKEWVSASQSDRLMIRELKFESNGTYTSDDMHYSAVVGRNYAVHSGEYHVVGNHIYMSVRKTSVDAYGNYGLEIRSLQNDVMEAELNWIPNYAYYDDGNGSYVEKAELDKDNMNYLIRLKRF